MALSANNILLPCLDADNEARVLANRCGIEASEAKIIVETARTVRSLYTKGEVYLPDDPNAYSSYVSADHVTEALINTQTFANWAIGFEPFNEEDYPLSTGVRFLSKIFVSLWVR